MNIEKYFFDKTYMKYNRKKVSIFQQLIKLQLPHIKIIARAKRWGYEQKI